MKAEEFLLIKAKSRVIEPLVAVEEGTEDRSGVGSPFIFLDSKNYSSVTVGMKPSGIQPLP